MLYLWRILGVAKSVVPIADLDVYSDVYSASDLGESVKEGNVWIELLNYDVIKTEKGA